MLWPRGGTRNSAPRECCDRHADWPRLWRRMDQQAHCAGKDSWYANLDDDRSVAFPAARDEQMMEVRTSGSAGHRSPLKVGVPSLSERPIVIGADDAFLSAMEEGSTAVQQFFEAVFQRRGRGSTNPSGGRRWQAMTHPILSLSSGCGRRHRRHSRRCPIRSEGATTILFQHHLYSQQNLNLNYIFLHQTLYF